MKKRTVCLILCLAMVISLISVNAFAENDDITVVVSMEGLTLGQGFYFEPKAYSLEEINTLVEGSYTKDELTAGIATWAFMLDNGIEYNMSGDWTSGAYLSSVKDIDTGVLNIPEVILEQGGFTAEEAKAIGNGDEYLGEFDYGMMSGWMLTVNDFMIDTGCADWMLQDSGNQGKYVSDLGSTYVIRWQFTLSGYGADLGVDTGWGNEPYFTAAAKAPLYAAYAAATDAEKKTEALAVMENLTASQTEVNTALAELETQTNTQKDYKTILNETMAQMAATVSEPAFGTSGGEWTVLSLARGGYLPITDKYFADYYSRVSETVKTTAASVNLNGALHKNKSTENARLIMALSAIGKEPTDVNGVNLIGAYDANGMTWIKKQGINGPVFALIALDTKNYVTADPTLRQQCIDFILSKELANGGWALSGTAADPDITSMVLQALAKYQDEKDVKAAAEKAFGALSDMQTENGGFASWGSVNSESIAQVITACAAWGINPATDTRFVKTSGSALDALLSFYVADGKGFSHVLVSGAGYTGGEVNAIATDQACYALVAYDRLINNQNALYDMTDVEMQDTGISVSISLPENVENKTGSTFNAVVNITGFEENSKLLDCIITIPEGVRVNSVSMGSGISGGEVSWNLEAETGKLRIVYFDEKGECITAAGSSPIELMTIGLSLEKMIASPSLQMTVSGMSIKTSSENMSIVNSSTAMATAKLKNNLTYSVKVLYTGDGVDLIPKNRKAILVSVTGLDAGEKLVYADGSDTIELSFSQEITDKTGVSSYVALINAEKELAGFLNKENYTLPSGSGSTVCFGDTNADGLVNAQDALNSVSYWLRKTNPTESQILSVNVTGDSRINTFDALAIVEHFVDGHEFAIVNLAATAQ